MNYRREDYLRHRRKILLKIKRGQQELLDCVSCKYKEVRDKFGISDCKIKRLLTRYTFSEILSGQKVKGKVVPKDLFSSFRNEDE